MTDRLRYKPLRIRPAESYEPRQNPDKDFTPNDRPPQVIFGPDENYGGYRPSRPGRSSPPAPRRRWRRSRRLFAGLLVALVAVEGLLTIRVAWTVHRPVSSTAYMRKDAELAESSDINAQLKVQLTHPAQEWVSLNNVSRDALMVLVSREDQQLVVRRRPFDVSDFWDRAIAWIDDNQDADPSGSTIPQQLAKNLFTNGQRSALRKFIEADYALLLSGTTSRRRILETYSNIIEFGPGVYGVCTASWYYFNKPPSQLTVQDMATLVGLMPNPKVNTIYPTSPNVKYARVYAKKYLRYLKTLPRPDLERLFSVEPDVAEPACSKMPVSLKALTAATSSTKGYPRFANDQSWWPRLTRQYANGDLPHTVRVDRCDLARRVPFTPGAELGISRTAAERARCARRT